MSAALAFERDRHPDRITEVTRNFLKGRVTYDYQDYLAASAIRDGLLCGPEIVFEDVTS
ncbi:hypothetical protein [Rhizobium rhizogenes]|uniref:hypothetical protein n=1 Tax=Rhizobium rhizogenes TaxID=359 RepID=UPI00157413FC|nr:hypothetical protein [Rhizobium rhizogenes]NTF97904.1 hypothetical protein [Rhizobium rhizogenes]